MTSTRITPNADSVPVAIVGGSTYGRYQKISPARTYNMYISTANNDKDQWLISFPGYRKILEIEPSGDGRAIFNSIKGSFVIFVVNATVYRIDANLSFIQLIGSLNTTSGEVFIAENLNQQIVFVDGTDAYIYYYGMSGTTIVQLTLDANLTPNYVEYHNTYFLFGNGATGPNGSEWYIYSPDPGDDENLTLVTNLAIQTKSDYALAVKRIPSYGNNVLVLGKSVCEIWTQIPGTQIYQRNPSINIDYGCVSVNTIDSGDTFIVWLARNAAEAPVIMYYDGRENKRISTDGIDYTLSQIQHPEDSTAILYRTDGHLFYQLTFYNDADNQTIVYDFTTGLFFNLSDYALNYHPARQIVYFNNTQYFCAINNGSIYELSPTLTYIDENPISDPDPDSSLIYPLQLIRTTPSIRQANSQRFIANSFVLTLEQGVDTNYNGELGVNYIISQDGDFIITEDNEFMVTENSATSNNFVGQGDYTPRIDLAISQDGGVTWSNYVPRTLHPLGYRKNILYWESMGVANDLCFKLRFWGLSRFVVNNALCDIIS